MKKNKDEIVLVGAGLMAMEYAKVLQALKKNFVVVGRSEKSAHIFTESTNIPVEIGGVDQWIKSIKTIPKMAIVAVTGSELGNAARTLIQAGIKFILLEKPGGINYRDIKKVEQLANINGSNVFLAYNRRFYSSTLKAKEIIKEDGGVSSFTFEFTEWSHKIKDLNKAAGIKENWFLHNSTHVIDLAFFLGGEPSEIKCFSKGGVNWHPSGSIFTGAGISKTNALFSYHANWGAPGRWWVEILTTKHRLIFRPMEKLYIQKIGSVSMDSVEINDKIDLEFKPGLYRQVEAFLNQEFSDLKSIQMQLRSLKYYLKIGNYRDKI